MFGDITAALITDLQTALGAGVDVYIGRRPRSVTSTGTEVWLERLPASFRPPGGARRETPQIHRIWDIRLHIRGQRGTQGSDQAGGAQLTSVDSTLDTIVGHYDGKARMAASITGLIVIDAQEIDVDVNPDDTKIQEAVVNLAFLVEV